MSALVGITQKGSKIIRLIVSNATLNSTASALGDLLYENQYGALVEAIATLDR